jgi:hypothetical protein
MVWNLTQAVFSVAAFALYVASTYEYFEQIFITEIVLTGFFIVDYTLNWLMTRNKFYWIWSLQGVIDMVTLVPVLAELIVRAVVPNSSAQLQFLRSLRVLRALRVARVLPVTKYAADETQKQIIQWFLAVVCVVLISAGIMQSVMSQERDEFTYNTALYFMTVTLATVGYGDIVPTTPTSRGVITVIVFIAFPLAAYQTARLISLQNAYDPQKGKFKLTPQRTHLIVTGTLYYTNVLAMFREIFHEERQNKNVSVCLLSMVVPDQDLRFMLDHPFYSQRAQYLLGSPLNVSDMLRARADAATLCIVLSPRHATNYKASDVETVQKYLRYLQMKLAVVLLVLLNPTFVVSMRRAFPEVRIAVELLGPENIPLISSFDPAISVTDYKMGLLGTSVRVPGFSTLLSNLLRTDGPSESEVMTWHAKYLNGAGLEIYSARLPVVFEGISFANAMAILYETFAVVLFAHRPNNDEKTISVAPMDAIMHEGDTVFMMADDAIPANTIEHLDKLPNALEYPPEDATPRHRIQHLIDQGSIAMTLSAKTTPIERESPKTMRRRFDSVGGPNLNVSSRTESIDDDDSVDCGNVDG